MLLIGRADRNVYFDPLKQSLFNKAECNGLYGKKKYLQIKQTLSSTSYKYGSYCKICSCTSLLIIDDLSNHSYTCFCELYHVWEMVLLARNH